MTALFRRRPALCAASVAVAPLLVALVVLRWRPWAPVLDLAMTEFRVRDVGGRNTPLIGLPGRIGDFPDQGSHPGPWSFYLLMPWYRLAGSTAWALQLGSVVVNATALIGVVAIGRRLAGTAGAVAMAAVAAIAIRGYGLNVLTHPWNPYFPLALWLLFLVAAWAAVAGHHRLIIVVAACGSIASQTHVPYLVSGVLVSLLTVGVTGRRWRTGSAAERKEIGTSMLVAFGVTVMLWLPTAVDQVRRKPGNMTMLVRHFTGEPPEPLVPVGLAIRVFLRHLDAFGMAVALVTHADGFVVRSGEPYTGVGGSTIGGLVVLAVWAAAAIWSLHRRHRLLVSLNAVVAVAILSALVSMMRIFGKVWFYLTLWAWSTLLLVLVSIAWTTMLVVRERHPFTTARVMTAVAVIGAFATALSLGGVVTQEVPESRLSDGLRAVVPATADALRAGAGASVGAEGTYLVSWQDALLIGSQGYGLVNELERRGFHVGVDAFWRVPVTNHRVLAAGESDAGIHLVTGRFIDEWRRRAGYVEVASADVRSVAEQARFEELRGRAQQRLRDIGRNELVETVDTDLFGASLAPDLPRDIVDDLSEMLLIGAPVSVFVGAPGG